MRRKKNNRLEIYGEDSGMIFSMEESYENGVFKIKMYGDVKNEVAYEFEDELMAALLSCKTVELDFENVTYIASSGMKSLLSAQQLLDEMGDASVWIINASGQLRNALEQAGFSDILAT